MNIITSHRSPNHNKIIRAVPTKMVIHHTGGTNSLSWLCSTKAKASANYLVEKNGTIFELVPPTMVAWHAGKAIAGWGNKDTIGVEIENLGDGKDTYPPAQIRAIAFLIRKFKISWENLKDHKAICIPRNRKSDMSANFPWHLVHEYAYPPQKVVEKMGTIFKDLKDDDYSAEAFKTLKNMGIFKGDTTGNVYPDKSIKRKDLAVVIFRLLQNRKMIK